MASLRSWIGSILSLVVFFLVRRFTIGIAAPTFVAITFACVYVWMLVLRVPELKGVKPAEPDETIQSPPKSSQESRPSAKDAPSIPEGDTKKSAAAGDVSSEQQDTAPVPEPPSTVCKEHIPQGQSASGSSLQPTTVEPQSGTTAAHEDILEPASANETMGQQAPLSSSETSLPPANAPGTERSTPNSEGLDNESHAETIEETTKLDRGQSRASSLPHDDSDSDSDDNDEHTNLEEDEDAHANPEKAQELRLEGNEYFKANKLHDAREAYSEALYLTPVADKKARSVLHANRAACLQKLSRWDDVIDDCKHAVDLDPTYAKAYLRRSTAHEALEKWHDANEDLKKAIELDPALKSKEYKRQTILEHRAQEQFEKDKDEMMDKLKGFGNMMLGKFGMSTDNFKCEKDPDSGSYSIKFQQ